MAVKKLKAVSPDKLLNKGADMKPVTTGQMNNQVIPEVNADIATNAAGIESNKAKNKSHQDILKSVALGPFASCGAAATAGVAAGSLVQINKTFKLGGEEPTDCTIPIYVLMPPECEGVCW